jgi:hypothetical protein
MAWLALLPLATGIGLLTHILAGSSLLAGAALAAGVGTVAAVAVWTRTPKAGRPALRRRTLAGVEAGALATLAYDGSRLLVVGLFPVSTWPFAALPVFGRLLVGPGAAPGLVTAAGIAYHAANGIGFGIAYVLLVRQPGPLTGLLWAAVLEMLMISLYPGWLDVRAVGELLSISVVGHVAYGLVLGWAARRRLGGRISS